MIRAMMSCDMLHAMGMPPTVLELPGGSASDVPPVLGNDVLACYMANLAVGAKGINYYIYTGGPNVPGTGSTCEIYDYGAPVGADGVINEPGYHAIKTFGLFMKAHGWLQRAHRFASVQLGFEWNVLAGETGHFEGKFTEGAEVMRMLEKGLIYTLMCSGYAPEMVLLTGGLDIHKPLIVPCEKHMSKEAQQAVRDFAKRGGKVLILPELPTMDLDGNAEGALADLFPGAVFTAPDGFSGPVLVENAGRVHGVNCRSICEKMPPNARAFAVSEAGDQVLGFEMPCGEGRVLWFGCRWEMNIFRHAVMMEKFLEMLGAEKCVTSSNRNVFTTLWMDDAGRRICFILNLHSSPQSSHIVIHAGGERDLGQVHLNAMEVCPVEF